MSFKSVLDSVTEMVNELVGNNDVQCARCKEMKSDTKLIQTKFHGAKPVCAKCVEEITSSSKS